MISCLTAGRPQEVDAPSNEWWPGGHHLQRRTVHHPAVQRGSWNRTLIQFDVRDSGIGFGAERFVGIDEKPSQLLCRATPGAPSPQVDGQLPGQGHDHLFLEARAVHQPLQQFHPGLPLRLPAEEPPHGFNQEGTQVGIAVAVDVSATLDSTGTMFTGATARVAADGLAAREAVPVAHLTVEEETFIGAVREYIQGKREVAIKETGVLDVDNSIAFTFKLGRVAGISRPDLDLVHEVVRDDTSDAPTIKFLTRFDFKNCAALGPPPSWLKQRPA